MARKRERGEGGLIRRAGCRYWYAQYYNQTGRQVRVSTKKESKEAAKGVLRRLMGEVERGAAPEIERKLRYADLRKLLLESYRDKGNKSLQVLSDGSETVWGLPKLDEFVGYSETNPGPPVARLFEIRDAFVEARRAENLSPSTINGSLRMLRRMLNLAYQKRLIAHPPYVELLQEAPPRDGFVELPQFEALVKNLPARFKPLAYFLYFCGTRKEEALAIEWSQVDLKEGVIELLRTQTKNKTPRFVPLPDMLINMLKKVKDKTGKVFDGEGLRREWEKACSAAGLGAREKREGRFDYKYSGLTIHDLRRSAVRNLISAGVAEKVAMEISGHKTRAVFDRYNIVSKKQILAAMRRVQDSENGANLVQNSLEAKPAIPQLTDKSVC